MATNPFPLNIITKVDSEDKLAQTAGIPENQKVMAAELNKITAGLDYLYATSKPYKCYECEFVNGVSAPFVFTAINAGILDRPSVADAGRLGMYYFNAGGTNSGGSVLLGGSTGSAHFLQNMSIQVVVKRYSAGTMMARVGFANGLGSAAAPSTGIYFEFTETGSYAYTANSGVRTLVNLPALVNGTWYRIVLTIIDRVPYFEMYNDTTGVLIATTSITTNIPSATTSFINSIGIMVHNNATGSGAPLAIDYINVKNQQ